MNKRMSRASIRKQINRNIKTDAELDAFCLDYFPDVQRQFGAGFSRVQKLNLLLEKELPADIQQKLSIFMTGASEQSPRSHSKSWLWLAGACILLISTPIAIVLKQVPLPSKNSQLTPEQRMIPSIPAGRVRENVDDGPSGPANSVLKSVERLDDPASASSLENLAMLLEAQGKYKDAEAVLRRVLAIRERAYGMSHPSYAQSLESLAGLIAKIDKLEEAVQLQRLALSALEKSYGPNHPIVASSLNRLAGYLLRLARYDQAEPLILRAIRIRESGLGPAHSSIIPLLANLQELYRLQGKSLLAGQSQQKIKQIEGRNQDQ